MSLETNASLKEVVDKAEQIDADLQNKKQLIATAVTGKDVPTNGSDSFQKMADNIDSIKTKLPILEGDAGVAEDNEGNVFNIINTKNIHSYKYKSDRYTEISALGAGPIGKVLLVKDYWIYYFCANSIIKRINVRDSITEDFITLPKIGDTKRIDCDKYENVYYSPDGNLYKLDTTGKIIWQKQLYSSQSELLEIKIEKENDFLYLFTKTTCKKLDLNGEILLEFVYKDNNWFFFQIDKQGNIYTASKTVGSDNIVKYANNGDIIWSYIYLQKGKASIWDIMVNKSGKSFIGTDENGYIEVISEKGKLLNSRSTSSNTDTSKDNIIYFVEGIDDYFCASVSDNGIRKMDEDLNEIWTLSSWGKGTLRVIIDGYYVTQGSGDLLRIFSDNYILEKVAVLKEREVTE